MESLGEAFQDVADRLAHAAEQSKPEIAWKAIVKTYLSLEYCDHVEYGCPLPALAPELARADKAMRPKIFEELKKYRSRMIPFMPGRRTVDKERAFFSIFSTMVGAIEIARMLPEAAMREKVLASARDLLLRSF
jgi:TetR/AcrR family transcriptional repressor of nem operon